MKVAILETGHFQYALTQLEVFSECEVFIITTANIKKDMLDYSGEISNRTYYIIENISKNAGDIIKIIEDEKVDLLLISPVFDSYDTLKRIVKRVSCTKIITIHNINTWFHANFWSPNSFLDKINMKSIIKHCDYVAVEDFIFNHLKSTNDMLFQRYKFLYIPFTIFHESKERKYKREDNRLKIVLTGAIDGDRRRYEDVLDVIEFFSDRSNEIQFSFAGKPKGEYGFRIQNKLIEIKKQYPHLVSFFDNSSTADMFRKEMETSDLVLSTSTKTFNGMGTLEYIGKTKPTAAIHDMMSYELPGLLPSHLTIPPNLLGSVFNYTSFDDLKNIINRLLDDQSIIQKWKSKAKENSLNFTAKKIRKQLSL